jgi:flagellar motility protein MotE (MotC chaperone)
MARRGERGASTVGSLLVLIFGGGAALVIIVLFMTGLAQKEIVPRIRQRAERALAVATKKAQPPAESVAAPQSPSDSLRASEADSLEALRAQVETQRQFLDRQKQDLVRMRGTIDSLVTAYQGRQNAELNRQAKLLAGMKAEEAARILEVMDDATISAILARMNARAAGKVLPKLDTSRVARLTMAAIGTMDVGSTLEATRPSGAPPASAQ